MAFKEFVVVANLSESKDVGSQMNTLFQTNEYLIPEQKQMNYFFIVRGDLEDKETEEILNQIKEIDVVQAALRIDAKKLKTKQNLVF